MIEERKIFAMNFFKKFSQRTHALVIILVKPFYKKRRNLVKHEFIAIIKKNETQWFLQTPSQNGQRGHQTSVPNFRKSQLGIALTNYSSKQKRTRDIH